MSKLLLFHGSPNMVMQPTYGQGKLYNDYGRGFYCTENVELAKEWACVEGLGGYANRYELETEGLAILRLDDAEYTLLNWLAILLANRGGRLSSPLEKRGRQYIIDHFLPKYEQYNAIIGYRADDSYFSFARAFVSNSISLNQLSYAMRLGKLGEQFVLKSPLAFARLRVLEAIKADNAVYFARRKSRDEEARATFQRELEREDMNGLYLRDIIREEIKSDDARLR